MSFVVWRAIATMLAIASLFWYKVTACLSGDAGTFVGHTFLAFNLGRVLSVIFFVYLALCLIIKI